MKALFFSPFARIIQHSVPEATVAQELIKNGYEVEIIGCEEALKGQCVVLSALGKAITTDQSFISATCTECQKCSKSLFSGIGLKNSIQELLYSSHTALEIDEKIAGIIRDVTADNLREFKYKGIAFGAISAYQHLIYFKKKDSAISPSEWPIFKRELENCFKIYFAIEQWQAKNKVLPDVVLIYNTLYGTNAVVRHFFEKAGVKVFSMHAGTNLHHFYDTLMLCPGDTFTHIHSLKHSWTNFRDKAVTRADVKWVLDHFRELAKGKSVFAYSAPKAGNSDDLRARWKIPAGAKVVLAAMSSNDERFAGEYVGALKQPTDSVFKNQVEWIKSLVELAQGRPELYFIIRIHPREFPNKREGMLSSHALEILDALKNIPVNVIVNNPQDKISLYNIIPIIDLALTSWSSVAKELMVFGIPIVVYSEDLQWFPPELVKIAHSKDEYYSFINESLKNGRSFSTVANALKWYVLESKWSALLLSTNLSAARSFWSRVAWRPFRSRGVSFQLQRRIGQVKSKDLLLELIAGNFYSKHRSQIEDNSSEKEVVEFFNKKLKKLFA